MKLYNITKNYNNCKLYKPKGGVEIMQKTNLNNKGFTLIELLIVIVIIAILAGVVIGVLNPVQQQNRARDGVARSSLSKVVLGAKSMMVSSTSTNRAPTGDQVWRTIGGATAPAAGQGTTCNGHTTLDGICTFGIGGINLGNNCSNSGYTGTAVSGACHFGYRQSTNAFRLAYKNQADDRVTVYQYDESTGSVTEGYWDCPNTYGLATAASGSNCVALN